MDDTPAIAHSSTSQPNMDKQANVTNHPQRTRHVTCQACRACHEPRLNAAWRTYQSCRINTESHKHAITTVKRSHNHPSEHAHRTATALKDQWSPGKPCHADNRHPITCLGCQASAEGAAGVQLPSVAATAGTAFLSMSLAVLTLPMSAPITGPSSKVDSS